MSDQKTDQQQSPISFCLPASASWLPISLLQFCLPPNRFVSRSNSAFCYLLHSDLRLRSRSGWVTGRRNQTCPEMEEPCRACATHGVDKNSVWSASLQVRIADLLLLPQIHTQTRSFFGRDLHFAQICLSRLSRAVSSPSRLELLSKSCRFWTKPSLSRIRAIFKLSLSRF